MEENTKVDVTNLLSHWKKTILYGKEGDCLKVNEGILSDRSHGKSLIDFMI